MQKSIMLEVSLNRRSNIMFGRQKIAMMVAEFVGAGTLALTLFSMQRYMPNTLSFFPALVAGLTVAVMVLIFGDVSGAHINPAITFGLWTARKIQTGRAIVYMAAQMLAGAGAWFLLRYWTTTSMFPLKNISGRNTDYKVLIAEAVGTFIFSFGFAAAVYRAYEGLQKAATIGASFAIGILVASFVSNGILNPSVALGINSFKLPYVVGPLLGAIVGINLYSLIFADRVEKVREVKVVPKKTAIKKAPAKKRRK